MSIWLGSRSSKKLRKYWHPICLSVENMMMSPPKSKPQVRTAELVFSRASCSPVSQSQRRQLLPAEPVRTCLVSRSASTHHTAPVWPMFVPSLSPFTEFHTLTGRVFGHGEEEVPSRLYLICVMGRPLMAQQQDRLHPGGDARRGNVREEAMPEEGTRPHYR
ncbi:hypothetical protein LEMLEM_LOCUS23778 [Lemmus lemmus]